MKLFGLSIIDIGELLGIIILFIAFVRWIFLKIRNIATKKDLKKLQQKNKEDCEKCNAVHKKRFAKGENEFNDIDTDIKEIKGIITDHGEQLAGISSTVQAVNSNVDKLVLHHFGGQ